MNSDKIKPVAVIMTVYNAGPFLKLAVDSFRNSTNYPYRLILIESESTDGSDKVCDEYATTDKRIKVIHTKKEGVTKAVNIGIKEAGDLDVFLTQCDVIFQRKFLADWLDEMVRASQIEDCGIVTCFGGGNKSGPDYLDGFIYTGTWCMFLPRKTINKVGLFDEEFSPGPGDDIDYSYRVKLANLRTFVINYWVDHHRMLETHVDESKNFGPIQKANGELFKRKHNIVNKQEDKK